LRLQVALLRVHFIAAVEIEKIHSTHIHQFSEWRLYWATKNNTRLKITPTLKKLKIRFESFSEWKR